MRKVLVSGMIGNALEWYDYALYGQLAYIISLLFFPGSNEINGLLQTFAVFSIGFFIRPLGGMLFGMIGDQYGRRHALSISVLCMAISTGMIGLLPTYAQIGIAAPLMLVLIRMVQGLSIGGELGGAITFIVEHAPGHKRGVIGSMVMFSLVIGFLMGSIVASTITHIFTDEFLLSIGWRLPFISGIMVGLIGFFIRRECEESPVYMQALEEETLTQEPIKDAFSHHRLSILRALGIYFLLTMPFYISTIFFITYNKIIVGMNIADALYYNTFSMIIMACAVPISGWIADHWGRKTTCQINSFIILFSAYPLFNGIQHGDLNTIIALQLTFAFLVGLYLGPIPALLAEIFPTPVRYTGMSFAANIEAAIFGGTTPMVCIWLMDTFGGTHAIAFYVMFAALCSFCALLGYKDRSWDELGP